MESRYFTLRFDVDTDVCLRKGVPNLLSLAKDTGASFTFFVSPGRAIDRSILLQRLCRRRSNAKTSQQKDRLRSRQKLATSDILRLLLHNPALLPAHSHIVRDALARNHEIGLHGGTNHGTWQSNAHNWPRERLASEVDHGMKILKAVTGATPRSFASPGWNSPPHLPTLLAARGFEVLADEHGEGGAFRRIDDSDLLAVPTQLAGEPGGVGYLEWHRARGTPTADVLDRLRRELDSDEPLVCLYDHPFYAGVHELDLTERILAAAYASGRQCVPLATATKALAPL